MHQSLKMKATRDKRGLHRLLLMKRSVNGALLFGHFQLTLVCCRCGISLCKFMVSSRSRSWQSGNSAQRRHESMFIVDLLHCLLFFFLFHFSQGFLKDYNIECSHYSLSQLAPLVLKYHTAKTLPILYCLAKSYTLCTNWFSSIPGPSSSQSYYSIHCRPHISK